MRFDVVTIFPGMFGPVFQQGVIGRAIERGVVELHAHDLREHTHDRHRQVDDMPFGGGPGMVIKPEPVFEAVESIRPHNPGPVVLMEPWGERLDQRVPTGLAAREISIGDYVLSGGEIPAMVLIDAVARLVPSIVGDPESLTQDSFSAEPSGWPQFTRPADYRGLMVPDVLLSGYHARIKQWRRHQAAERSSVHTKEYKKT